MDIRGTPEDPNARRITQGTTEDPAAAVEEGRPYLAPIDPVVEPVDQGDLEVVGGFAATATDGDASPARPASGGAPDAALEDAIRAALRGDAATTDLRVEVEVRDGVAYLRGRVSDLADADSALEVAGRCPGVVDVVDELVLGSDQEVRK